MKRAFCYSPDAALSIFYARGSLSRLSAGFHEMENNYVSGSMAIIFFVYASCIIPNKFSATSLAYTRWSSMEATSFP